MGVWRTVWGGYRRGGICGLYHWIRCHTWNRYHIIDIRNESDYDWGWIDRDRAMFLACFKILEDFVEKEDPDVGLRKPEDYSVVDDDGSLARQLEWEREIRALYIWWTEDRPRALLDGWRTHDEDRKDDEMLARLMKVRKHLWT